MDDFIKKFKSYNFVREVILAELPRHNPDLIIKESNLILYIMAKTNSVYSSSKSRGSYGSVYPIYSLVEDYLNVISVTPNYSEYTGTKFSVLHDRQKELPFGGKLQNHGLNNRINDDYKKVIGMARKEVRIDEIKPPILRDIRLKRYWINEELLIVPVNEKVNINIATLVKKIIEKYIELKQGSFNNFLEICQNFKENYSTENVEFIEFVKEQLSPQTDARIFEILSYSIVKFYYYEKTLFFGLTPDAIEEVSIELHKTGRANANDGGIDFIMKPLGRVFQVTEDLDFKKFFLDIDKLNKFPISFVVKTDLSGKEVLKKIKKDASKIYDKVDIKEKYLSYFEDIITLENLDSYLEEIIQRGLVPDFLDEVIMQCKVEFNIVD